MAAPEETLRRRKAGNSGPEPETPPESGRDPTGCPARLRTGTFWLTRIVLLRALAFIYFVAFLVALHQNKQLIGDRGLLPCRAYLESVRRYFRGRGGWDAVSYAPTVLWLLDWSHMNANLDALALLGLGVSSFVLVTGCANMVLMATLWVLYMSLVNVGQIWYSFGWESQLLETGFLVIFLCPLWTLSRLPTGTPPSQIVLWGFRWLIFRIMLGAGLIKIRGDRCWRDLTCMDFHYEVVLVISGNLSFLNWLTMVPSIACFDDAALGFWFPSGPGGLKDQVRKMQEEAARGARPTLRYGCVVRQAVHVALGILVAWLSVPVVLNLLSPTQVMNTSFNSLRIVNTYGAFGSITKERTEVILQGTASPNASAPDAVWEDYGFKCKPGDPGRRPCLISPYHYRLDWLMWFAAFQTYEHNEWIIHLAGKLLANDREALSLLAFNPFKDRAPPRWVRGEHYRYKFSRLGGRHAAAGSWWVRKRIGPYFPPLSLRDLEGYFRSRDWPLPELE
ncbi:lipase maturation factor 1 isoform X3 [Leopardus geoffroyi]|uniref:lipase maturation factor 1 isoform X3 n=1 Tax=Leopardus geoffroyi TaxID=46844 RepID=UPI001E264D8A|nr:lipase maturation factor 1 isoform X3 [Leopardus geoffroyi]